MLVQELIIAFAWYLSFLNCFFFILTRTLVIWVYNDNLYCIKVKALVGRQVRFGMSLMLWRGRLLSLWLLFHFALFFISIVIKG